MAVNSYFLRCISLCVQYGLAGGGVVSLGCKFPSFVPLFLGVFLGGADILKCQTAPFTTKKNLKIAQSK